MTRPDKDAPPPNQFGTNIPSWLQRWALRATHKLPASYIGRKAASALLGLTGGRRRKSYDVTIFGTQKARLHPYDNICEKRVYATPQMWDAREREILKSHIERSADNQFYFVDAGANVGLYTLFGKAIAELAKKDFRAICIEPDPQMRKRLSFNLTASDANTMVQIFAYALATTRRTLRFTINEKSRGMSHVDDDGALPVQGATLTDIIMRETNFDRIDALKIDIEGSELEVLEGFFSESNRDLHPRLVIVEISHADDAQGIFDLFAHNNYQLVYSNNLNAVFAV